MESKQVYYSGKEKKLLGQEDYIPLNAWLKGTKGPAAISDTGIRIFLEPEEIDVNDEYRDGDPYTVEKNISSSFHTRRFTITTGLMKHLLGGTDKEYRILDIACGEGHITEEIRKVFKASSVFGIDYSLSAISRAASLYPDIDFCVGSALDLPYKDNYFDFVVCNNIWEHVTDPLGMLREIKRVSKPGSFVLISTPSRYHTVNLLRALIGKKIQLTSRHHVTEYTVGQVKEQLSWLGYEVVSLPPLPKQRNRFNTLKGKIVGGGLSALINFYIRLTGSHHSLEGTVFFVGRNNKPPVSSPNQSHG